MRNFTITSGSFTGAGNFTAYNALGERIFVHKRIMESQALSATALPQYPLFAIIDNKMIGQFAEDGHTPLTNADGTPVMVERLQALSIFKTKQALIDAHVDNATLDVEIKSAVSTKATEAGLTKESIDRLLAVAF